MFESVAVLLITQKYWYFKIRINKPDLDILNVFKGVNTDFFKGTVICRQMVFSNCLLLMQTFSS